MTDLLRIRDLTVRFYTYDGVVSALDGLALDIGARETFGLVGETGCGKTMTALAILRLVPPPGKIECGEVLFDADVRGSPIDLLKLDEAEIRSIRGSKIAMVFQEPSAALNPVFTIGDQIQESVLLHRRQELARNALETLDDLAVRSDGLRAALFRPARSMERVLYGDIAEARNPLWRRPVGRVPLVRRLLWRLKDEAREIAIDALREVEIADPARIFKLYPHELSGGMKQRCVIAMALACHPRLLIADEPTTALDVTIQAQMLELLRRLKVEKESSILYITHDLAVAAEICDRIGVMYAGSLCEVATAEELYSNPLHPYTKALMAAVPKPGEEPHSIAGGVPDPLGLPSGCRFHPRCPSCGGGCSEEVPRMQEVAPGHSVACHMQWGGMSESAS
jgi:peptide/nickel transport system ATP-binding protein